MWELLDGKWVAEVVTMFDAHQPGWASRVRGEHPTARKVLSLRQGDMVAYDHPKDGFTIGRVVKFNTAGQIFFAGHREAGNLKARDADHEDPFKYFSKAASGLGNVQARQVRVDETGRVFDPGPQDRSSRKNRKGELQERPA